MLLRFHCYILCVLGIPCTRSWASLNPWCSFERFKLWASFQTSKLETLWIGKYLPELWGEFWEAQVGTYTQLMKCPHRSLQLVILAEMQACLVSRPLDSGMPSQNHMQRAAKNILRHNLPSEAPLLFKRKENKQRYNLQSETQLLFKRKT